MALERQINGSIILAQKLKLLRMNGLREKGLMIP